MAKTAKVEYVCSSCGGTFLKWYGRCPNCQEWNSLSEEAVVKQTSKSARPSKLVSLDDITLEGDERISTGLSELDRVLGGGIVNGSAVLIGGEPGAGKSTLLLQVCGCCADDRIKMYFSGEESIKQIKLRADRLGVECSRIAVSNETDVDAITAEIYRVKPAVCVVDSIQTMRCADVESAVGSVSQIRECSARLLGCAKESGVPVFIVGHVNKDGALAGPKVMEHIVDTVLYFEGDKFLSHRILRAVKNRFGSTNELGIFEMTGEGLKCVANPSAALLEDRNTDVSGSCVTCAMEGSRPILCEIQSLVAKSSFAAPRRTSAGFDFNRTNLLIAVLEKRAGVLFSSLDVYINVAGGLWVSQPTADLAVAASLLSSVFDKPVPADAIMLGEIGLGGEIRRAPSLELCVAEAERLGYKICYVPKANVGKMKKPDGIKIVPVDTVADVIKIFKQ